MGVPGNQWFDWTDAAVLQLKALWADGLSCSQIAGEIGCSSRSAVIGKVSRLGLERRAISPRRIKPRAERRTPFKPKPSSDRTARDAARTARQLQLDAEEAGALTDLSAENNIPLGQRCSLFELTDENCHWPCGEPGDPDFFFCGGKARDGLPYCGYHYCVAYQPPAARRDRRPARI